VSRSKKTAKAKHYAFLEFQHPDVAQIAAQTMDGYFLFKQVGPGAGTVLLSRLHLRSWGWGLQGL